MRRVTDINENARYRSQYPVSDQNQTVQAGITCACATVPACGCADSAGWHNLRHQHKHRVPGIEHQVPHDLYQKHEILGAFVFYLLCQSVSACVPACQCACVSLPVRMFGCKIQISIICKQIADYYASYLYDIFKSWVISFPKKHVSIIRAFITVFEY